MASVDPWTQIQPGFLNTWFSDAYSRDNDILTRAVQNSPPTAFIPPETTPTPTVSGISGSDPESIPRRPRNAVPGASGKVSKRKSRAAKRSQTTFITADATIFRQMVQQVTGVKFVGGSHPAPVLKPEPHRACRRVQAGGAGAEDGCLPTLDSSAWLLDQCQPQLQVAGAAGQLIVNPHAVAANGLVNLEALANYPTLESWKVVS